jgi:hypothetical protein
MSAPTFPKIGTMPSRVLALLLQGHRITHKDFWIHAGTYCLRDPVFRLREKGWDIRDTPETVPTSDPTKRQAHIKRYHLAQTAISAAGKAGRDFVRSVQEWERMRASGVVRAILAGEK